LLIGDSLRAVSVSSLVDTPLNVMLLGDLQRVGFRLVNLSEGLKIWISVDVTLSLFISKYFVTSFISLFFRSSLVPVLFSVLGVAKADFLNNIRISVHVASSLIIGHWSSC
jgi:hypothetical protein